MRAFSFTLAATGLISISLVGCDGSAGTTDDSTRIEVEVPKVEIGDAPIDLDPTTDNDVDIDTPLEGDS
ncbi:MAG: hypothetical protein WBD31_20765 [Rubripirellula sp.]